MAMTRRRWPSDSIASKVRCAVSSAWWKTTAYCIDVLTQIAAVNTALESLAFKVLDDHVNHCVTDALASGNPREAAAKSKELMEAVQRFARTR